MSEPFRVLVSDSLSEAGLAPLVEAPNIELDYRPGLPADELLALIPDYHALLVRQRVQGDSGRIGRGEKSARRRARRRGRR